jgi:thiol-disulfide isomerase/thioredoxin
MSKLPRLFPLFVITLCLAATFGPLAAPRARAETLDLTPYKGKVVYLDFWASWCGPCKESFPWLMQLQSSHSHKDFAVIAVNVDHDRAKAEKFLEQTGSDLQVVYDPEGKLAEKYKVKGMPSAVLIGRDGRIHYRHTGFYENETAKYEQQVSELISEK